MSRGIKFVTIKHIKTRTAKWISTSLEWFMNLYFRGRMIVKTFLVDMEFDNTIDEMAENIVVSISAVK